MLALSSGWAVPKTDSIQDMGAADRYMQFHLGIFTHPIFVNGDYPDVVKNIVGNRCEAAGLQAASLASLRKRKLWSTKLRFVWPESLLNRQSG